MKTCAFIGHQPYNRTYKQILERDMYSICEGLKKSLFCETLRLTREGVQVFMTGMDRCVDTWAAEAVIQIRDTMPSRGIQLWAVIPYDDRFSAWSREEQRQYKRILEKADKVIHIAHEYTPGCLEEHTRYMIDASTHLIAVYEESAINTRKKIEYARRKGLEITIIEP